jgi:hypothetical protein
LSLITGKIPTEQPYLTKHSQPANMPVQLCFIFCVFASPTPLMPTRVLP